ncbi:MAG: M48 family metalloprotease [bacterium]|nr:M48 family metalloprotease [bacterium]
MGLPVVFLIGLLVVFGAREFDPPIAGSGDLDRLLLASFPLLLPAMLLMLARGVQRLQLAAGRYHGPLPGLLQRLSIAASPLVLLLFCVYGCWPDFAWRWSHDSHTLSFTLLLLPLLVVELPRVVLSTQLAFWLEMGREVARSAGLVRPQLPGVFELLPVIRLRFGWILLVSVPWLLLGVGLDVLGLSRAVHSFVLGTSLGITLGFFALLASAALALPLLFRFAFGAHERFPPLLGAELRMTAATLGFPPQRVLLLPTGMSAINAMMVGPLAATRCLCITDGLVRVLDADALAGVVAHEVGHARMGHPGLLMLLAVVVPMLALHPLSLLAIGDLDAFTQMLAALMAASLIWLVVRSLAHRFELEADVASVRALGAEPCSRALRSVMDSTMPVRRSLLGRLSSMHPDERARLATMARYEGEPAFRERFDAAGRRLRIAVFGATLLMLAAAIWVWVFDWRYERAIWSFQNGDFAAATAQHTAIGDDVPAHWQETWAIFTSELTAANELAAGATDWKSARRLLMPGAFDRGTATLLRDGPAAALPWFALAAEAADRATATGGGWLLLQQLYELSRAAHDGDAARVEAVREVIKRRPVPAVLQPVID